MSDPPAWNLLGLAAECRQARQRLAPHLPATPLRRCDDPQTGASFFFKCEHGQPTGSFKVRGALNRLAVLSPEERRGGVVAASTGNHGAAVAWAAARLGIKARVFVPENALPEKMAKIRALGALLVEVGDDGLVAELAARDFAAEAQLPYVSPYNDPWVVAGQGTLGLELLEQSADLAEVYIALGGGGLLSGAAAALKADRPNVRVIGCSPKNSAVMMASVRAGRILDLPSLPTLSDGTAGGVEAGALTFPWVQDLMNEAVEVSEDEIRRSLVRLWILGYEVEGAAAVAFAAATSAAQRPRTGARVVVLCGGNVSHSLEGQMREAAGGPMDD